MKRLIFLLLLLGTLVGLLGFQFESTRSIMAQGQTPTLDATSIRETLSVTVVPSSTPLPSPTLTPFPTVPTATLDVLAPTLTLMPTLTPFRRPDTVMEAVVVARENIPRGTRIHIGMLAVEDWPSDSVPVNGFARLNDIGSNSYLARTDISRGAPILSTALAISYQNLVSIGSDAALSLPPETLGISLSYSSIQQQPEYLSNFDRVDIYVIFPLVEDTQAICLVGSGIKLIDIEPSTTQMTLALDAVIASYLIWLEAAGFKFILASTEGDTLTVNCAP